jgi:hypothetical protein
VDALDRDGKPLARGTLAAVDNQIDVTTGTVKFKGQFDTAPLERQFGQMPGLAQMSSSSSGGSSVITLQFSLDLSLDTAEQEVQAAINAASSFLPTDLPKGSFDGPLRAYKGRPVAAYVRPFLHAADGAVRACPQMGAESRETDVASRRGHSRADHPVVCSHPQGIFPDSGYGCNTRNNRSAGVDLLLGMARKQSDLARVLLKDPAVDTISSYIGVDGTNTTLNSGRMLINLVAKSERDVDNIRDLYVATINGNKIPLSSVAQVSERVSPLVVNHIGQFPSATISFNLASGASLGHAVRDIRAAEKAIGMPASVETSFQGAANAFQASLSNTLWLILAAVVTVYIVLGVLYESYIHPVTILSTLPSAGVGALLALMIAGQDLGIVGIIGIVLLIGIVKKNAIMMIDFALQAERGEGKPPREAIYEAALLRLRPILMTTMAAMLGALPLMLGTGMGSELDNLSLMAHLAHCRLHPHSPDGRYRRSPVPRIRRDLVGCNSRLAGRLAEHHADDVRAAFAPARRRAQTRPVVSRYGARV